MQFVDLKYQYQTVQAQINDAILGVLQHGQYILGPEVFDLEGKLASYTGAEFCVSCSSGTDALLMSLMAAEIEPGDAVFTSPFTFIATAEVIKLVGATPIFVDIKEDTFNIDPNLLNQSVKNCLSMGKLQPKAVIPVDLFGLPAEYENIEQIGNEFNLLILADAAQSFGGSIKGKRTGSFGHLTAASFFPAKPLGCYGDGGAIFTNNEHIVEKLISIRVHGQGNSKYNNIRIGINGRMDTIQAAILLEKLKIFPDEMEKRSQIAVKYRQLLNSHFVCQDIPDGYESSWAQFSLLATNTKERSLCREQLKSFGIPTAVYYNKPLHLQDAFKNVGYNEGDFPVSESISKRIFSVPMHPYLADEDVKQICEILLSIKEKCNEE